MMMSTVIQGTADVGKQLTEDELERTMEFCQRRQRLHPSTIPFLTQQSHFSDIFAPADTAIVKSVAERLGATRPELLSLTTPVFRPEQLSQAIDPDDTEASAVLNRINTSKALAPMWMGGPALFEVEPVKGFVAQLKRGELGLMPIGASCV